MKTKNELIEAYKKANKLRREKIAINNGFRTGDEYLKSLLQSGKAIIPNKPKKKSPRPAKVQEERQMLDYVIAFDSTGSMGSYIAQVKEHVNSIIPEMFSQGIDLKMKIVVFGDYCDMINRQTFGRAYQESHFTDNQKDLIKFVNNAKNTGGGDSEEFYELVIQKIINETPWRAGSIKSVLFIADDNPHKVGYYHPNVDSANHKNTIDWKVEAKRAAAFGIAFDTLSIHGNRYPWYKELSKITGGVYMPFQSSGKTDKVMKAAAYVRGSTASKEAFTAMYHAATASGDEELIGTYKSLSTLL